jgi:glycosyl transferase family 25
MPTPADLPPIFVVNLERSPERREAITTSLEPLGLEFEFFAAVDGNQLGTEDLSVYSESDAIKTVGRALTLGEIGCYLSHVGVWKEIVARNLPEALVLEDDAEIGLAALEILARRQFLPTDWEFINFLSDTRQTTLGNPIWDIYRVAEFRGWANGSVAYLLSQGGARRLLAHAFPIKLAVDGLTGRTENTGLKMYGIFPQVASMKPIPSTIADRGNLRPNKKKFLLVRRVLRRLLRSLG